MRLTARFAVLASFVLLGCNDTTKPPATFEVSPTTLTLDVGESRTISATVKQGDASTPAAGATWLTSDPTVVTASGNADGTATVLAKRAGTATLTAKLNDFSATVAVTVNATAATLTRIELTPANARVAAGLTLQLTATGIFSDGTMRDVSTTATWNASNDRVLTVASNGLATGVAQGTVTVTATLAGQTATLQVTVTDAVLNSIEVTPSQPSLAVGTTQQFVATGRFADGTTQDLSTQVTWASSAEAVATVDDEGLVRGVSAGNALISATLEGVSGGTTVTVTAATLSSIDVSPSPLSLAKGVKRQLTATGHFSDGSTQDVTAQATWASATATTATISAGGEVTAVDVGSSVITATIGSVSGTLTVTVTAAELVSLEVSPAMPSISLGQTQQFVATGTYSDATTQTVTDQVTWLSTVATVATVSNAAGSHGLVSTHAAGTAVIGASLGTITGGTTLTVTNAVLTQIQVTPTNPSVPLGLTQQFTATGVFSDGTQQNITTAVTWATDAATTATINNAVGGQGLLNTVAVGTTAVRATQGTISGTTNVTVTAATLSRIDVTPTAPTLAKGRTQQLTATGVYSDNTSQNLTTQVSWGTATAAAVTISPAGLATAVDVGSSVVTAQLGTVSGTTTVTVTGAALTAIEITPAIVNVPRGLTQQLVATARYSDNTTAPITSQVTWSSGTTSIATISNAAGSHGVVTGVAVGSSTISALLDGVTGTLGINVVAATLSSIAVTPTAPSIAKGRTQQFTATGTFSDGSTQNLTSTVTWTSATPSQVTVSNAAGSKGLATAVAVGSSVITATLDGVSGSTTMTVTAAVLVNIAVTPATISVAKGRTQQFIATGTYSDATNGPITADVTWSSSSTATAVISNASGSNGLSTALAEGTSTITAALGGLSGTASVTVTAATLVNITVTPANASVIAGRTQQFVATGTYSDATFSDISNSVTWSSSTPARATVSNATGSKGLATGLTVGSTNIVATSGTISGQTALSVTAAVLESIVITPSPVSVVAGATQQLVATGRYSDGSETTLTNTVTWSSDATAHATVSNAAGSQGLVTGVATGTANVSATQGTVTAAVVVTVTAAPATLVSIAVTPSAPSIAAGGSQQFTATATYSDSTSGDVSAQVTWASSNTAAATIDATGLATAVAPGSGNILATLGAVTGSTTLTVTAAMVTSIVVTPASATIALGRTQQFVATATYSDGSTGDVSATATWASATVGVATVSSSGLATSVSQGTAVISATVGAVSGSAMLTVGAAELVSIEVQPNPRSVNVGSTDAVSVTGHYSDGSTASVAATATYTSANPAIATASNGVVTGVSAGTTTITVSVGSVSDTLTVNVNAVTVTLNSIAVTGAATLKNVVTKFTATGTYSDGSTQDVTATATWASSTAATASVSNLAGHKGEVVPLVAGTTNITATVGSVVGTLATTVVDAQGAQGKTVNHLVISQIYGGGGNSGASTFTHDFVELFNPTNAPISVSGMSVQYASETGNTWTVVTLGSVSIQAGGYFLVRQATGGTNTTALPTADATGSQNMSASGGKVALVNGTTALTASCPTTPNIIDLVGFGSSANCFEGARAPAGGNALAQVRVSAGCRDNNSTVSDFVTAVPSPRNSGNNVIACDYYVNDFATAAAEEVPFCGLQYPSSTSVAAGAATESVYARIYKAGATEAAGAATNLIVQIGYGASMSSPLATTSWRWTPATFNVDVSNNDEFQAAFIAPVAGNYSYTARASFDGVNWTACDLNGAGSNTNLAFETTQLGVLTVTP